ncbi:hypothetical protein IE4872_PC00224 (plasmid) [Rhizobium gallicum]|uniref:Uncharacterized protein n=1 Tax=Rhizobium gallicum TaxID=56730 RepID=A0A1L5NQV7_9HYPH|nr:hypothetical protein IE4872_PC00224 [Rhizobium gallicum]
MQVLDLKPVAHRSGGRMLHVANFDMQLSDNVAIYGMRLLRAPNGDHVSYAPTALGGRRSVTFGGPLAEAITAAALRTFMELDTANGATSAE